MDCFKRILRRLGNKNFFLMFSNEVGRGFFSFDWRKVNCDLMFKVNIFFDVIIYSGICCLICK